MTAEAKTEHAGIYAALAASQMQMGKALKSASNPHFKSKYADLSSVMDACLPALNANGIAVMQPIREVDGKMFAVTVLAHSSGETMECPVPLIVQKNDMQGLGSAITYARRYGLMSMAGIAPEDDDGNAAAAAAPKKIDADQFVIIRNMMDETDADEAKMLQFVGAKSLEEMTVPQFDTAMSALRKKKSQSEAGK